MSNNITTGTRDDVQYHDGGSLFQQQDGGGGHQSKQVDHNIFFFSKTICFIFELYKVLNEPIIDAGTMIHEDYLHKDSCIMSVMPVSYEVA